MTSGSLLKHLIMFAFPLLLGNIFQLLYNTVDTLVVGQFVGTAALAAVGSTSTIVNVMVFFFNGLSIGAGVVISRYYGAKDFDNLHTSVETTIAMTLAVGVFFTILGVLWVRPMLLFMATPDDVMPEATLYLRIYFAGIGGLMIYNMGSGILRAIGDTKRPLMFLILTSILNIILDLFFVIVLRAGIAGVAIATILSQFVSAALVMGLLTKTDDIYKVTWHDMGIRWPILREILNIGLPAAFQSMITSFSNVFVQSYINVFGAACMAGWSCYNKLGQFVFLPCQSMSSAATTLVSQNVGARDLKRAERGIGVTLAVSILITTIEVIFVEIFANTATGFFTKDPEVIRFGATFLRINIVFMIANCLNHVLAGGIRGMGDSKGPMFVMMACFVGVRQIYLYTMTHFVVNTPIVVGLGYPVGWMACCICLSTYFFYKRKSWR